MLTKNEILEVLKTYNIYSQKYEPTIYENNNNIGLCLDIKDPLFGYLTRIFLFNQKEELQTFLNGFFWYKNNHQKYNINLTLNNYQTKTPQIIYQYKNEEISIKNMLNITSFLQEEQKEKEEDQEKEYYLLCIEELTNYLIEFKQMKENIKLEKNKLKTEENDLKFELLTELTTYYGREKKANKKEITLDPPTPIDNTLLLENQKNIKTKTLPEIKEYLSALINIIKAEELDEKNLVNIYSNSVYKYNIEILKKQIEFVKNKINAEKNFNVKGSKIHNIDEELRSFLKTGVAPTRIEIFLIDNKEKIETKFKSITDIKNAIQVITGKTISLQTQNENPITLSQEDRINYLINSFNNLPPQTQSKLILYNSIYKPICNFIINNNYPDINTISSSFDFNHYYQELEEIVYNENNNHYLVKYFSLINFKDLSSYINSLIEISKEVENTIFTIPSYLSLFATNEINNCKQLTILPTQNTKYLVKANKLLLIPEKLEIDWDTKEISTIKENTFYTKEKIIEEKESIILSKYTKKNIEKDGIIVTTDLILESEITFNKSHLEGENHG